MLGTVIKIGIVQRTLIYFVRGSISVKLTSCLTGFNQTSKYGTNSALAESKQSKQEVDHKMRLPVTKKVCVVWHCD